MAILKLLRKKDAGKITKNKPKSKNIDKYKTDLPAESNI